MNHKDLLGNENLAEKMDKLRKQMEGFSNQEEDENTISSEKVKSLRSIQSTPKLFVNGRLNRKTYTYTARSLFLLNETLEEMNTFCRGSELAILNFLIKEGLKNVKASKEIINVDINNLEKGEY